MLSLYLSIYLARSLTGKKGGARLRERNGTYVLYNTCENDLAGCILFGRLASGSACSNYIVRARMRNSCATCARRRRARARSAKLCVMEKLGKILRRAVAVTQMYPEYVRIERESAQREKLII